MARKFKIAVFGAKGFPAWGGAARANEEIFSRLAQKFDITVYAVDSHASKKSFKGMSQIIFKSVKNKKLSTFLYNIKSLMHALFFSSYDLVHVNHLASGYVIPFLRLRYPVVLNVRGMNYNRDDKWNAYEKYILKLFQWMGIRFSNVIITVEKGSVSELNFLGGKKVEFIPNGISNVSLPNLSQEEKFFDITFSAARIIYLKGLHLLMDALQSMKFQGKIQIIGDIDQVKSYRDLIIEKSKGLNCTFVGLIHDKNELFRKISNSKLFVFPSYSEGMSNMLLEVASLKVPILASDIKQNIDIFYPDEVLFFHSESVSNLIEKIRFAISNEKLINEMANKAHTHLLKDYDWDKISLSYNYVYDVLLNRKK